MRKDQTTDGQTRPSTNGRPEETRSARLAARATAGPALIDSAYCRYLIVYLHEEGRSQVAVQTCSFLLQAIYSPPAHTCLFLPAPWTQVGPSTWPLAECSQLQRWLNEA